MEKFTSTRQNQLKDSTLCQAADPQH